MHKAFLALACLACGSLGQHVHRAVQSSASSASQNQLDVYDADAEATSTFNPVNSFATLLLALDPATAFNSNLNLNRAKAPTRMPTARSHPAQMRENFAVKATIPGQGTGLIKFTPILEKSEAVVLEIPTEADGPVSPRLAPDRKTKTLAVMTEDGDYGERAGDILRFTTKWVLGLPSGDSVVNSGLQIAGALKWQISIFDTAKASKWSDVTDAVESNKESVVDRAVMIFERPVQ